MDKAVTLQTAILSSVRKRLKELQAEQGHENPGETIEWLLNEHNEFIEHDQHYMHTLIQTED